MSRSTGFLILVAFAALFILAGLLGSLKQQPPPSFDDNNRQPWFYRMEKEFHDNKISREEQVPHALVALSDHPDLQVAMNGRFELYQKVAQTTEWPWAGFKDDISKISDAAIDYKKPSKKKFFGIRSGNDHDNNLNRMSIKDLQSTLNEIEDASRMLDVAGIHFPWPNWPDWPDINMPIPEDILRKLREELARAKHALELILEDGTAQAPEVIERVHEYISTQVALLPEEIKGAIVKFEAYRKEHPYIVAAATVVLIIVTNELIVGPAALALLRAFGFSEIGPVAGSWAAAIQSAFYAGRTRGLFSIIQSITMGAKSFWPVIVFLDLAEIATSIVLWSGEEVKQVVEQWRTEIPLPDWKMFTEHTVEEGSQVANWMIVLGEKCKDAGIPEVQWLDVALQFVTREVQTSVVRL